MPIVTYSKFSKKEERNILYLRWQGYENGKKIQKHMGKAGVPEDENRALKKETQYLRELIERTKDELYLREQELKKLETRMSEEYSIRKDRKVTAMTAVVIDNSIPEDRKEFILPDRKTEDIPKVKTESDIIDEQILALWAPKYRTLDKVEVFRLYEQGIPLKEISERLKIKYRTLEHWEDKFKTLL